MRQRHALDELHRIPRDALLDSLVDDAHHAGMAQARQGADLAPQALQQSLPGQPDGLERHLLAAETVLGAVDHAHAAAAEHLDDPVGAYSLRLLRHVSGPFAPLASGSRRSSEPLAASVVPGCCFAAAAALRAMRPQPR